MAVISELNKLNTNNEILYLGSEEGLESKIIPQAGLNFRSVPCGKFRRYHKNTLLNIIDPTTIYKNSRDFFRFLKGYSKSKRIINDFDPDIVFTKGGYVSLPVGLAASSLGYPLVIHESDSVMGLSNRILSKKAAVTCVSYPVDVYKGTGLTNLVYTGNPIRKDISEGDKKRGIKDFDLNDKEPVLMIIGGSQGSYVINQIIAEGLPEILNKYQLIHVTGERDYDWLDYQRKKLNEEQKKRYRLYNYLSGNLKDAYAVSDLVISRSGNNAIAELAALAKPTILVPLSTSANDHQLTNAKILSRMGAALLMLQEHLTSKKLIRQIDLLFESPEDMKSMGEKIHTLALEDAAEKVANEIIKKGREFEKQNVEE